MWTENENLARIAAATAAIIAIGAISIVGQARDKRPYPGIVSDYSRFYDHMPDGCDNHFFSFYGELSRGVPRFVSYADGTHAVMNLDGKDTALRSLSTQTAHKKGTDIAVHRYAASGYQITVRFADETDYISDYPARVEITANGRTRRFRLFGWAQCD